MLLEINMDKNFIIVYYWFERFNLYFYLIDFKLILWFDVFYERVWYLKNIMLILDD